MVDLDLSLDEEVSRLHACIWADEEGGYWVEDRGSKHGTFVAGKDLRGQGAVALASRDGVARRPDDTRPVAGAAAG